MMRAARSNASTGNSHDLLRQSARDQKGSATWRGGLQTEISVKRDALRSAEFRLRDAEAGTNDFYIYENRRAGIGLTAMCEPFCPDQ